MFRKILSLELFMSEEKRMFSQATQATQKMPLAVSRPQHAATKLPWDVVTVTDVFLRAHPNGTPFVTKRLICKYEKELRYLWNATYDKKVICK